MSPVELIAGVRSVGVPHSAHHRYLEEFMRIQSAPVLMEHYFRVLGCRFVAVAV
jgi:hypothetical protein